MSTWEACKKAVASGVNVLITHEPTFYTHRDLGEVPGEVGLPAAGRAFQQHR